MCESDNRFPMIPLHSVCVTWGVGVAALTLFGASGCWLLSLAACSCSLAKRCFSSRVRDTWTLPQTTVKSTTSNVNDHLSFIRKTWLSNAIPKYSKSLRCTHSWGLWNGWWGTVHFAIHTCTSWTATKDVIDLLESKEKHPITVHFAMWQNCGGVFTHISDLCGWAGCVLSLLWLVHLVYV